MKTALAAGITVRLIVIAIAAMTRGVDAFIVSDSFTYLYPAATLATRFAFEDLFGDPELHRTPGYPLLLTPGMLVSAAVPYALIVNLLLTAAIVIATFHIARQVLDERLATICAWIVALEPTMMTWSLKVMPETLLVLCLALFALFAIRGQPVAAGAALAAAAYVKPIAYPLVILALLWWRPRKHALVFLATCVALLAPWHIRNAARTGYAGFSTIMERTVYLGAGGAVIAQREGQPYEEVRRRLMQRDDLVRSGGDPARFARIRRKGAAIVADDPLAWATIHVKGIARTLLDPGAVEYLRFFDLYREGGRAAMAQGGLFAAARAYPLGFGLSIVLALVLLPLLLLPVYAAVRNPRNRAFTLFALITLYLVVAGGGLHGYHRFRVPAVPFLALMSAFALRRRPQS